MIRPGAGAPAAAGGGLFGQQQPQQQPQQQAGGLFGAQQPQQQPATPSLFGGQAIAPSAFGAAAPAVSSFGAAPQQQQQQPQAQNLVAQFGYDTDGRGSRVTQFLPKAVKQTNTSTSSTTETWEQYRSISAMDAYQTKSHEELRLKTIRQA